MPLHKTLQRQIKKFLSAPDAIPSEYQALLQAVSDTYTHTDEDRALIERSLELSSREMMQKNSNLEQEKQKLEEKTHQLERMNKLMIDRELKMVELKQQIKKLQGGL
jgi:hypothetical protein